MKIAGVKRNINDKTLTIPTPINATMNADSTMITIGSDIAVMRYKYRCERLTSGVCNLEIAC